MMNTDSMGGSRGTARPRRCGHARRPARGGPCCGTVRRKSRRPLLSGRGQDRFSCVPHLWAWGWFAIGGLRTGRSSSAIQHTAHPTEALGPLGPSRWRTANTDSLVTRVRTLRWWLRDITSARPENERRPRRACRPDQAGRARQRESRRPPKPGRPWRRGMRRAGGPA